MVQQLIVEYTDWIGACNVLGLVLQFDNRISTLPGLFDLIYAVAVGYFTDSDLWLNGINMTKTSYGTDCKTFGKNMGFVMSQMFSYNFQNEYFKFGISENDV